MRPMVYRLHRATIHSDPSKHSGCILQGFFCRSELAAEQPSQCADIDRAASNCRSSLRSASLKPLLPLASSSFRRS